VVTLLLPDGLASLPRRIARFAVSKRAARKEATA